MGQTNQCIVVYAITMVKVEADFGLWKRKTNIVPIIFVLSLRTVSNSAFRFQWQNVEIMCGLLGVEVHIFSRHDLQQLLSAGSFFLGSAVYNATNK